MGRLDEIGEDEVIRRATGLVPCGQGWEGPGDDCAVWDGGGRNLVLLKTDALVEGVHFTRDAPPGKIGWKAIARVSSDFAAMGGWPERFLVTIAWRGSGEIGWLEDVYGGMGECMKRHGGILAGGESCRIPEEGCGMISIAATGGVERGKAISRAGGESGDFLWVTGRLGGSLRGRHLNFPPRVEEGMWLAENFGVKAMMDLSDGLAKDLPRLAAASGCGFVLEREKIPLNEGCSIGEGLGDGEDFELLLAGPEIGVERGWAERFPDVPLTRIGRLVDEGDGEELEGGWDHFQGNRGGCGSG